MTATLPRRSPQTPENTAENGQILIIPKNNKKILDKSDNGYYNNRAFRKTPKAFSVGVDDIEGPPVPIPNTVVKLNSAENTWAAAPREDRKTPTQTATAQ